MNSQDKVLAR